MPQSQEIKISHILEGKKVILKKRDLSQAGELFKLIENSREHLRPWMPWEEKTRTVNDVTSYLNSTLEMWDQGKMFDFTLYCKSTGEMAGSAGLHSLNWETKTCEVGYWIAKKFEGQGLILEATELLESLALSLGFHRLYLVCDTKNIRSKRIASRHRFRHEAHLINADMCCGVWRDVDRFVKLLNPAKPGFETENLPFDFSIRQSSPEEFSQVAELYMDQIFEDDLIVRPAEILSDLEKEKLKKLNSQWKYNYEQYFLVFYKEQVAGWSWGYQDSRESFYMVNSAVLPEFRNKGLYKSLLEVSLKKLVGMGFQRIWSRHTTTNNSIITTKLKAGFVISAIETSDIFGQLLHLTYFTNPLRQNIMDFRTGQKRPNSAVKKALKL